MQCACAMLSSVACPFVQHFFPILSHKWQGFVKKNIEHKMCVLILSTTLARKISYSTQKWASFDQNCAQVFMYIVLCSCRILARLEFSLQIFEKFPNVRFLKSRPVGAQLFRADGRTDGWTARQTWRSYSRFSQFCELAKKMNWKFHGGKW